MFYTIILLLCLTLLIFILKLAAFLYLKRVSRVNIEMF